ncbi:hypothetical protein M0812_10738 [Anaeramoeba flamelloides]|uniref:B box-type domain-containing protein n=1 Tax=Anaeramoeba flamelloides TaxID=1746091 RepID=A0AAV7ZWA1_9EUKA|nr:hypothetical protein M0812_10738 [Anaeramoeba flamelloides]
MTDIYEDLFLCDQCDNRSTHFCVNCSCGFCDKHNTEHHKVAMENHKRVAITPKTDFTLLLCSRHSYELNSYFCKSCSELICSKCKTTTHREHEVILIEEMRNDLTEKVKMHHQSYTVNKEKSDKFFHEWEQLRSDLEQEQKEYIYDVESKLEKLVQIINKKKVELIGQIQKEQKIKLDIVNEKIEKYNSFKKSFDEYGSTAKRSFNLLESPQDSNYLFVNYGSKLPKDNQFEFEVAELTKESLPKTGFGTHLLIENQIKSLDQISLRQIYCLEKTTIINKGKISLGDPIEIQGFLKDKSDNGIKSLSNIKFEIEIVNKLNKEAKKKRIQLKIDEENGGYSGKYIPKEVGKYLIIGMINKHPIKENNEALNSFEVVLPFCLKKSEIKMDGIILPNESSDIFLQLKDYNNQNVEPKIRLDFDLTVTGKSMEMPLKLKKVENEKGKYQSQLKLVEGGVYSLGVKINGNKLFHSPYNFKIGYHIDVFRIPKLAKSSVDIMSFGSRNNSSQKPDIVLLNNNRSAKNMWNNDASGHYVFGKMRLVTPKKYKFNIKINKKSGSNLQLGIGKFSNHSDEVVESALLWDCGKKKLIPSKNSKNKYGEQVKKGQTINLVIDMQKKTLIFGKESVLFDPAFDNLPNSCILVFRLFGKNDQISFV